MRAAAAALLLLAAGTAGHTPVFLAPAPPVFQTAPRPVPLAPPTSPAPMPAPPTSGISPLLLGPGVAASPPTGPATPGLAAPSPIDQQKLRAYRGTLLDARRALEQQGVSPTDERYREIQQQLQQLDSGGSP